MAQRDLEKEKRALSTYTQNYGKLPSTSEDWSNLHKLAYPTPNEMPDEFRSALGSSASAAGLASPGPAPAPELTGIDQLAANKDSAFQDVQRLSQGPQALEVLQGAIRAKAGFQDRPIGENPLFKELGVQGMGALSQSIAAQHTKLASDAVIMQNYVKTAADEYKTAATLASNSYDKAFDEWKMATERLQKQEDDVLNRKHAFDLIKAQSDSKIAFEQWARANPTIAEQLDMRQQRVDFGAEGLDAFGDPLPDTVFESPSGDTYDVAPYAVNDDGTPNMEHINNMRYAAQRMGKLETAQDITDYIERDYPESPITAEMVQKASEEFGVDWETILATMVAETLMGTDGSSGSRMNNFGNVGNTNQAMKDGKPVGLQSAQAGVNAVARTMANPRYKRNKVGGFSSAGGGVITPEGWDVSRFTQAFYRSKNGLKALDNEQQYNTNFLSQPAVRDFLTVQTKAQSINSIIDNGVGGPADLALVFEFMKALDPNSVVRESEYETAAKSGNIFKGVLAKFNGYMREEGGFLPDNVKEQFKEIANRKLEINRNTYEQIRNNARKTAWNQGLNPDNVASDLIVVGKANSEVLGVKKEESSNDPLGIR